MFARRRSLTASAGLVSFAAPAFSADTLSPQAAQVAESHDREATKKTRRSKATRTKVER